jgi:hypothetical protein
MFKISLLRRLQFVCQERFLIKYNGLGQEWQETVSFLPLASSRQFDTG